METETVDKQLHADEPVYEETANQLEPAAAPMNTDNGTKPGVDENMDDDIELPVQSGQVGKPLMVEESSKVIPRAQLKNVPQTYIFDPHLANAGTSKAPGTSVNFNSSLPIRNYEVFSQYKGRKYVYENVVTTLKDHNKAITYSNIWFNMTYFGVRYPKNLEDAVAKFAPPENNKFT